MINTVQLVIFVVTTISVANWIVCQPNSNELKPSPNKIPQAKPSNGNQSPLTTHINPTQVPMTTPTNFKSKSALPEHLNLNKITTPKTGLGDGKPQEFGSGQTTVHGLGNGNNSGKDNPKPDQGLVKNHQEPNTTSGKQLPNPNKPENKSGNGIDHTIPTPNPGLTESTHPAKYGVLSNESSISEVGLKTEKLKQEENTSASPHRESVTGMPNVVKGQEKPGSGNGDPKHQTGSGFEMNHTEVYVEQVMKGQANEVSTAKPVTKA